MLVLLLSASLFAQEPEPAKEEPAPKRVKMAAKHFDNMHSELSALSALLRDVRLVDHGYAPDGWVTPTMEAYEASNGRPSLLPIDVVEKAVKEGACSPLALAAYKKWEEQVIQEAEEPKDSGIPEE